MKEMLRNAERRAMLIDGQGPKNSFWGLGLERSQLIQFVLQY